MADQPFAGWNALWPADANTRTSEGRSFAADPVLYFPADDESSNTDYAAVAASLNSLLAKTAPSNAISGRDLRDLVRQKWGRSYDVRLAKLQGRMYLQGESNCLELGGGCRV